MTEITTLHDKLIDIQQRLKVPKDRSNEFGGFTYRSIEDIEDKVKPFLLEHRLTLRFTDTPMAVGDRVYIEATAILTDGTDSITVSAVAREADKPKAKTDDAQLTGGTSSYARKYAASGLFLIDNTADADSTNNGKTPKKIDLSAQENLASAKAQVFKAFKDAGIDDSQVMLDVIEKATGKVTIDNYDDAMSVIAALKD